MMLIPIFCYFIQCRKKQHVYIFAWLVSRWSRGPGERKLCMAFMALEKAFWAKAIVWSQPGHNASPQVSVINDLKGTKECRNKQLLSGKRSNSSKENASVVKTPSSVSLVKISLKPQPPDQLAPKGWWCWPLLTCVTPINSSLDSVDCPTPSWTCTFP